MRRFICICSILLLLCGCATVGTRTWHRNRLQEIEEAYKSGEITKAEYLQLKNEADKVRVVRKGSTKAISLDNILDN